MITKYILTKQQREAGLTATEEADDFVILRNRYGNPFAYFTQRTTIEELQETADKYLMEVDWQ